MNKNTQMALQSITGPLNDFFKKLLSEEGEQWLSAFKKFLRKENPWKANELRDNVFRVLVNYDLSVKEAIEAGKYDWKNGDINDKNFPFKRFGSAEIDIRLVHFNKDMSSEDVLKELDKMGLRPAELPELLALGAECPDEQRKYPIVALGSVRQRWHSGYVPDLWLDSVGRSLGLSCFELDWRAHCRFAAVGK